MSQTIFSSIVPSTTSGSALATILTDFKNAVVSGFSGTTRPTNLQAGGYWIDITNDGSGTWDYKLYDGSQDIKVFTINKSTGVASFASADSLFKIEKISADAIGPVVELLKKRIANGGQTLTGDSIGEIKFKGYTNAGDSTTQAMIKSVANDNVTTSAQGSYLVFEVTEKATASIVEVMRMVDKKVAIGTTTPDETLHVKGTGTKVEKESDDAVGSKVVLKKKRIGGTGGGVVSSDVVGQVDFVGHSTSNLDATAAQIEVVAREATTASAQGSSIRVKNKKLGQTVYTTQIQIDDKTRIDDLSVTNAVSVEGTNGVVIERTAANDAVGSKQSFKKKRVASSGQVVTSDQIGVTEYTSLTNTGAEVVNAQIEVVAREVQTSTNQGSRITIRNKKLATNSFTDQIVIDDVVTITDLVVTNLTATNSNVLTTSETQDASIVVNKGGNQASANAATSGFEVEMSNATNFKVGYDSTKASKLVAGEVGALKEVVNVDSTQTLQNKTISAALNTINTAASGNLTSTNLNAALAELQSDIDTRATSTALTTHTGAASGAHAASAISNTASGNLTSTDVQASLVELQTDVDNRAVGAASSTANQIPSFSGTDGKTLQATVTTLTTAGVLSGVTQANVDNIRLDGDTISKTDTNGSLVLQGNGTGPVIVLGAADGTIALDARASSAVTSSEVNAINLRATSTGDMANNFGAAIRWTIRDTAAVTNIIGVTSFVRAGDDTSGAFIVTTLQTGATKESLRVSPDGVLDCFQPNITSKSVSTTLTLSELRTRIVQYTGAAANLQLPLGTDIETGLNGVQTNSSFDFSVINTGSGSATLTTNTGLTLIGSMAIANGTSGQFRVRKTSANNYTIYRLS